MKVAMRYQIRVLLSRKEFYFVLCFNFIICLFHQGLVIWNQAGRYVHQIKAAAFQTLLLDINMDLYSTFTIILPLLCVFLFSDTLLVDEKCNIQKTVTAKMNRRHIVLSKYIITVLACFLVFTIPFLFDLCWAYFTFPNEILPNNFEVSQAAVTIDPTFFLNWLLYENPILFVLIAVVKQGVIAALLAGTAFCLSLYVKNRYIVNFSMLAFSIITVFISSEFSVFGFLKTDNGIYSLLNLLLFVTAFIIVNIVLLGFYFSHRRDVM